MSKSSSAPAAKDDELSPMAFDILVSAVNLARFENIRTVAVLRKRLSEELPNATSESIDQALRFWARRAVETGAHAY